MSLRFCHSTGPRKDQGVGFRVREGPTWLGQLAALFCVFNNSAVIGFLIVAPTQFAIPSRKRRVTQSGGGQKKTGADLS
jgi:hypothetical protein